MVMLKGSSTTSRLDNTSRTDYPFFSSSASFVAVFFNLQKYQIPSNHQYLTFSTIWQPQFHTHYRHNVILTYDVWGS